MLLKDYPGYEKAVARAVARESAQRRSAFFPHLTRIGRLPVLPFTPRHFLFLDEAASPFLGDFRAQAGHVAQFVWVVSPEFLIPSPQVALREVRAARAAFNFRAARLRYPRVLSQIGDYLSNALFDVPRRGKNGTTSAPAVSLAAALIDEFGSEYGWLPERLDPRGQPVPGGGVLDMPFAWLMQFRRARHLRKHPDAYLKNPLSDDAGRAVIARHIARKNERQKRKGTVK